VLEAADGKQAPAKARTEKPDLILLDIMMPEMGGYTTCNALKADSATKEFRWSLLTTAQYETNENLSRQLGDIGSRLHTRNSWLLLARF